MIYSNTVHLAMREYSACLRLRESMFDEDCVGLSSLYPCECVSTLIVCSVKELVGNLG